MGFCCTVSSQHKCLSGNIKALCLATGFAESKPEHKVSSSRTSLQPASQQIRIFSYYDLVPSGTEPREVHLHGGEREDPVSHTHCTPWGSSHSQWTGQDRPSTQEGGSGAQRMLKWYMLIMQYIYKQNKINYAQKKASKKIFFQQYLIVFNVQIFYFLG